MKRTIRWPFLLVFVVAAAAIGYVGSRWLGLNFWISFGVAAGALLLNGWIMSWEDNRPGGFNGPNGKDKN